jgi:uncharacterized protein with PIN domain
MYLNASAIVAILAEEDAGYSIAKLEDANRQISVHP